MSESAAGPLEIYIPRGLGLGKGAGILTNFICGWGIQQSLRAFTLGDKRVPW